MLDDYSSFYERILEKSGKFSMNIKRKHKLCIEIYKTLNNSNLSFMKEIFEMFQACKRAIKTEFKYSKKKVGRLWK